MGITDFVSAFHGLPNGNIIMLSAAVVYVLIMLIRDRQR